MFYSVRESVEPLSNENLPNTTDIIFWLGHIRECITKFNEPTSNASVDLENLLLSNWISHERFHLPTLISEQILITVRKQIWHGLVNGSYVLSVVRSISRGKRTHYFVNDMVAEIKYLFVLVFDLKEKCIRFY